MNYNQESKKAFIKYQTMAFAFELHLKAKYNLYQQSSMEVLLNTFLNSGWLLTEEEKAKMITEVNDKFRKNKGLII